MPSKIVIVTGAAGGIGFAIAEAFIQGGFYAVLLDMKQDMLSTVIEKLPRGLASGYACDVTNEAQIQKLFTDIHQQHGRIDVLVNNAGLQYIAPIESFPTDKFRYMLDVMLTAPFIATKHVLPFMKQKRFGRIINMASVNGLIGFAGKAAYNSAKHGLVGLTKVTALETAAHGITVNAVCPGYVDTDLVRNQLADIARARGISETNVLEEVIFPLVPQRRLLGVREIADMVLWLAGEQSGGITGQSIVIDGGYTAQ